MPITFTVEPTVTPEKRYRATPQRHREPNGEQPLPEAWRSMLQPKGSIEAMSPAPDGTVATFTRQNMLAKAVHAAFYGHHRLILSPDVIWLTIAQGLAHHVAQNAEELRSAFVDHEGKKELVVERPQFVKGSPRNDWEGVFPDFAAQIAANTKHGVAELVQSDFSTTGPAERIASQVTLMDAVQHYFSYTMCCGCGFPAITLSGTPQDWEAVRAKAARLAAYGLDWWLRALLPALDQFVAAAHGTPDLAFWRSLCNINTGTSFPIYEPLTGWIQVFFPYLLRPGSDFDRGREAQGPKAEGMPMQRNTCLDNYAASHAAQVNVTNFKGGRGSFGMGGCGSDDDEGDPTSGTKSGVKLELFPPGLSSAPFLYKDVATGVAHQMAFFSGATCLVQHDDGALEPKVGWAVLDSGLTGALEN